MNNYSYLTTKLKAKNWRARHDELIARLLLLNEKITDKILHRKYMLMIISREIYDAKFDDDNKTFSFLVRPEGLWW